MLLRYFKLSDFDSPDAVGSSENMKRHVLLALDNARHWVELYWNKKGKQKIIFRITSGFRTYSHNSSLPNSSVTSSHLRGVAVDIYAPTLAHKFVIVIALALHGFFRIGIATTFIHADMDKSKDPAIWFYGGMLAHVKKIVSSSLN